jgi:lycopene cyclase domain-containing protein
MLPPESEYLVVLMVLMLFVAAAAWEQVRTLAKERAFWLSLVVYLVLCIALDIIAVRLRWWSFPAPTNFGITVGGVPIEEFILFVVIFVSATAAWKFLER